MPDFVHINLVDMNAREAKGPGPGARLRPLCCMNENTQVNDGYSLGEVENSNSAEQKKRSRYEGAPLLLAVQLAVSVIFLTVMFAFKFIGGEYFNLVRGWYMENINNSIITAADGGESADSFNVKVPFINLKNKEKVIETFVVNEENDVEPATVGLSVGISNPIDRGVITSKFGKRVDPLSGEEKLHGGLDICAEDGAPIYAIMPGTVEKAWNSASFGNAVIIDHGNGIRTLYAHCKEINVSEGDHIKRKQNIALMGNTGRYSTGVHLHFELIINGKKYDPEPFFENIYV